MMPTGASSNATRNRSSLGEFFFRPPLLRHVAKKTGDTWASAVFQHVAGNVDNQDVTVFSQNRDRRAAREFLHVRLNSLQRAGDFGRRMNVHKRHRTKFFFRIAEHPANRGICLGNAFAFKVDDDQAIEHAVIDRSKFVEAAAEGRLHLLLFRGIYKESFVGPLQFGGPFFDSFFKFLAGLLQGLFRACDR